MNQPPVGRTYSWSQRTNLPPRVRAAVEAERAVQEQLGRQMTGRFAVDSATGRMYFEAPGGSWTSSPRTVDSLAATMVRGRHYVSWSPTVAQLKREGRWQEALALLFECVVAAEADARAQGLPAPAPGWTKNAAIVCRKLGDYDDEIAALERYQAACRPGYRNAEFTARIAKAKELRAKAQAKRRTP